VVLKPKNFVTVLLRHEFFRNLLCGTVTENFVTVLLRHKFFRKFCLWHWNQKLRHGFIEAGVFQEVLFVVLKPKTSSRFYWGMSFSGSFFVVLKQKNFVTVSLRHEFFRKFCLWYWKRKLHHGFIEARVFQEVLFVVLKPKTSSRFYWGTSFSGSFFVVLKPKTSSRFHWGTSFSGSLFVVLKPKTSSRFYWGMSFSGTFFVVLKPKNFVTVLLRHEFFRKFLCGT
jgi:hypothetical protein